MDQVSFYSVVLALDHWHPAKRFLSAFIECRGDCVGLHLDRREPIEQQWESATDGRLWTFSGFAYAFLSTDLLLDEFHQCAPSANEANLDWPWNLPRVRALMHECSEAARECGNGEILNLTDDILKMFDLWEEYLHFRKEMVSKTDC
jgi:hypothetical protein